MLDVAVFCSGALVMILEMVGARILAPHVGTSAIAWTSIIGVVLAFLALGSWAGGRLADKNLSKRNLSFVLALAGTGTAITAFCHAYIGELATALLKNIYEAAVMAAIGIFALPAFFFGMITPYIVRLRLSGIATAGSTVGRLYALSTTGSIIGTFLGGFILISWFSSTTILWCVAICMFLISLCIYIFYPFFRLAAILLFSILASQTLSSFNLQASHKKKLVESPYNVIQIMEGKDYRHGEAPVRLMATDPSYSQSGMLLDDPQKLYFDYTRFYALGPYYKPDAKKILMLGGGGYSVPKWLLAEKSAIANPKNLELTVIELDPAMTKVARKEFALKDDPRMKIFHEDARLFLNRQKDQFDIIFVDVFNSHYSIPFHVGTRQAMKKLGSALAPDGILLMNIISAITKEDGRLFRSIFGAMKEHFPAIKIYGVSHPGKPDEVQNIILVASKNKLVQPKKPSSKIDMDPKVDEIEKMEANLYTQQILADVPALDDDFAPVDRYSLMLNQ